MQTENVTTAKTIKSIKKNVTKSKTTEVKSVETPVSVVEAENKVVSQKEKKEKQFNKIEEQQKSFDELINATTQILKDNINNQKQLLMQLNLIKQTHNKHVKTLLKTSKLRNNKNSTIVKKRNPAGFAKPASISKELYTFFIKQLGQDKIKSILSKSSNNEIYNATDFVFSEDTKISRTDATKLLSFYYNEKNLFGLKKEDGTIDHRTIIPNAELKTLFNLNEKDTFTYFNQQTLLKFHFPKTIV
jgi:hypothetical protein